MLGIGAWANCDCRNLIRCDKFCGLPPLVVTVESFNRFLLLSELLDDGDMADDAVDELFAAELFEVAPPADVDDGVVDDVGGTGFVVDDIVKCWICSVV